MGGTPLSSNWKPGEPVSQHISITMLPTPGRHKVYFGLYHPVTRDRLAVDAPDFRPFIGEITAGG